MAEPSVLDPIVEYAGIVVGTGVAVFGLVRGRSKWEPAVSELSMMQERLPVVLGGIAMVVMWVQYRDGAAPGLLRWTVALGACAAVSFLIYLGLVVVFIFDKISVGQDATETKEKIVGGFLTPEARSEQRRRKSTVQELLEAAGYNPDKLWSRWSRAIVKATMVLMYMAVVGASSTALAAGGIWLDRAHRAKPSSPSPADRLSKPASEWVASWNAVHDVADATHSWPTDSLARRTSFEAAWTNAGETERRLAQQSLLAQALGAAVDSHRIEEDGSVTKLASLQWADEALRYFQSTAQKADMVNASLDKAAIYFDIAQLLHTKAEAFRAQAEAGEKLVVEASPLATPEQQVKLLRMWSRFYYGLARPKSGGLDGPWDEPYLQQSLDKADQGVRLAPTDLKTVVQAARTVERMGRSTARAKDKGWASKMRQVLTQLRQTWTLRQASVSVPRDRLAALNTMAVLTAEVLLREWQLATAPRGPTTGAAIKERREGQAQIAQASLKEIDELGVAPQNEMLTLVTGTELRDAFSFDARYDLGRIWLVRYRFDKAINSDARIETALLQFSEALKVASLRQRDDSKTALAEDPIFSTLPPPLLQELKKLFQ